MIAASWADVEIADELLSQVGVTAAITQLPGIGRDFVLFVPWKAGLLFLAEPGHARNLAQRC